MTKPKPISDITKEMKPNKSNGHYERVETDCDPDCEICGGVAFVKNLSNFGKIEPCPNRPPQPIKWNLFGLSEKFDTLGWDDIVDLNGSKKVTAALKDMIDQGYGWLYIHGGNGLGKTYLSSIATAEAIRLGMSAEIMLVADLLNYLKDSFSGEGKSTMTRMNELISLDVLVLDEFGAHKSTAWAEESIQTILQKRYKNASEDAKGITIFTSEQPPEVAAARYIQDRLRDSRLGKLTVIEMTGKSVRTMAGRLEGGK